MTTATATAGEVRRMPNVITQQPDPREVGARVEDVLAELASTADPRVRERAEELAQLLVQLYGGGLTRIVDIVRAQAPDAQQLMARLSDDELVASLLVVHGLHPLDVTQRVQHALDKVRPYLGSHAGGVQLLGVDEDGVVTLRLEGSCDGCPSSTVTVRLAIERAITEAAPEVTRVEVEGMTDPATAPGTEPGRKPGFVPLDSLRQQPAGDREPAGRWTVLPGAGSLVPGEVRLVDVAGTPVVVCNVGGELYAYRDGCPACGASLSGAALAEGVLGCTCHSRYDARLAGRRLDGSGVHLSPLPLLTEGGRTRIAVPAQAAP
ncbi:MAG: NifU family protein [Carbonactinosporaceae bacterium]